MASLLIRDIPETTKKNLAVRAAQHGRSQQSEALCILREAIDGNSESWVDVLRRAAEDVGGIELPEPVRHAPRLTGVQL